MKKNLTDNKNSHPVYSSSAAYPSFCSHASVKDSIYQNFRTHPAYTFVLEHVSREQGRLYIDAISATNPSLLTSYDKFKVNDRIGNPALSNYEGVGDTSPTTLRYVKVLSDLMMDFESLEGMNIVEIGCGYGGQSVIIDKKFKINKYIFVDLPEVLPLIHRYVKDCNVRFDSMFIDGNAATTLQDLKLDLVISNYAFSECHTEIQKKYINLILAHCPKGYLTINDNGGSFGVESYGYNELTDLVPHKMTKKAEDPQTGDGNYILKWKN